MGVLLDILRGVGNVADLPGSSVRDIFARRNPLDQWMTPFGDQNRATGRDVLRTYGMAGEQDTGMNAAGGMATEMALDPLSWLGAGALFKALKGAGRVAGAAGTAGRAVQRTGLQQALSKSARPTTAMSIASPVAGAYLMGDNEEGAPWKNWVGGAMMAAPLAMGGLAMAKGLKGGAKAGKTAMELPPLTKSRQVQNADGKWTVVTEPVEDILHSDELRDSLGVYNATGQKESVRRKFAGDVKIILGEQAASREEQLEAARRLMSGVPAPHTWSQRSADLQKMQQVREDANAALAAKPKPEDMPSFDLDGIEVPNPFWRGRTDNILKPGKGTLRSVAPFAAAAGAGALSRILQDRRQEGA